MVYLGYDFSLPIIDEIDALPILVKKIPLHEKLGSRKSILERCGSFYFKCLKFIQS